MKALLLSAVLLAVVTQDESYDSDYPIYENYANVYFDCVTTNANRIASSTTDVRTIMFGSTESCQDILIAIRSLWGSDVAVATSRIKNRILGSMFK